MPSVSADDGLLGKVAGQRLDGPFRLPLFSESEARVQKDDSDDRSPERRASAYERKRAREPEEKSKRVDELLDELAWPTPASAPSELVRTVRDEPPLRFSGGESLRARLQIAQQPVDGLPRIGATIGCVGRVEAHSPRHATLSHVPGVARTGFLSRLTVSRFVR
jgi:hypothetical protein